MLAVLVESARFCRGGGGSQSQRRTERLYRRYSSPNLSSKYSLLWLFRVLSGRRSQIEFPTVEVDGVDEVLLIAETARRGLDPLNP